MTDLEDGVRTMLARRAGDVAPQRPPWDELVARGPVVEPAPLPARGGRRPLLAVAAVVVAVAGVAAVVVADRPATVDTAPATAPPGHADAPFDPATAPPVWPTGGDGTVATWFSHVNRTRARPADVSTPERAAAAYLADRVDVPVVVGEGDVDEVAGLASFPWTFSEDPDGPGGEPDEPATSGRVWLRRIPIVTGDAWAVVGAVDDEVTVAVTAEGGLAPTLSLTVRATETADSLAVGVLSDGQPIQVGGEPLPQGGDDEPMLGELVEAPADIRVRVPFGVTVVRVRQVGGAFLSVTEMGVPPTVRESFALLPEESPLDPTPVADPVEAAGAAVPGPEPAAEPVQDLPGSDRYLVAVGETSTVILRSVPGGWVVVGVAARGVWPEDGRDYVLVASTAPGTASVRVGDREPQTVQLQGAAVGVPVPAEDGEVVEITVDWPDGGTSYAAFRMP